MNIKLSDSTIKVLQNFSAINPNLRIEPGSTLATIDVDHVILAQAQVEEVFETPFAIYDLKEFLSTIAMFEAPVLNFDKEVVTIGDENDPSLKTFYYSANLDLINPVKVPDLSKVLRSSAKFVMPNMTLKRIRKASSTLTLKNLKFEAVGGVLSVTVRDKKGANNNTFSVSLDDEWVGSEFCVNLDISKFEIMDCNYTIDVLTSIPSNNSPAVPRALLFTSDEQHVKYIISIDAD